MRAEFRGDALRAGDQRRYEDRVDGNPHLEQAIEEQRFAESVNDSSEDPASQRKPGEERGQHRAGSKHSRAEDQREHADP